MRARPRGGLEPRSARLGGRRRVACVGNVIVLAEHVTHCAPLPAAQQGAVELSAALRWRCSAVRWNLAQHGARWNLAQRGEVELSAARGAVELSAARRGGT